METNKYTPPPTPKTSSMLTWLFYALIAMLILLIGYKAYKERQKNQTELADDKKISDTLNETGYLDAENGTGSVYDPNAPEGVGNVYKDSTLENSTTVEDPVVNGPEMKDMGLDNSTKTSKTAGTTATAPAPDPDAGLEVVVEDEPSGTSAGLKPKYMVITGSFRQMLGAETQMEQLVKKGFGEAEIGKFNRGTYACPIAYRTDDLGEARALATRLRKAGFTDTIVKIRKSKK